MCLCGFGLWVGLIRQESSCPDAIVSDCATGELMQSERDALLKLIQSLRHEYEAVQAAKLGQESEIQGLKVQPCPPAYSPCTCYNCACCTTRPISQLFL